MTKLEQLIQDLCPNGVKMVKLGDVVDVLRGKRLTKSELSEDAQYNVYHGGLEPLGKYHLANREADTVMVINVGASAGTVGYSDMPFWSSDGCFCLSHSNEVNNKYLYYYLQTETNTLVSRVRRAGIPTLDSNSVLSLQITLPPLAVQSEIVRILDKFTLYKSELAAELAARCKQYEHYRNQLLTFDENTKRVKLGEMAELKAGSFVSRSEITDVNTDRFPCYGGNGIRGYVNHYSHEGQFSIIGRQGALCGCVHYVTGKFYATEHAVVVRTKEIVLSKYLYYILVHANLNQFKSQGAQPGLAVSNLNQLEFPLPPLEVQERIVAILDRFDALCHDIREGLPAEIELRQKQYEHYRDKLLTF